jgi:hypothetical protein
VDTVAETTTTTTTTKLLPFFSSTLPHAPCERCHRRSIQSLLALSLCQSYSCFVFRDTHRCSAEKMFASRSILANLKKAPLQRFVHVENKIASLGLQMPAPAVPKGSFVNFVVVDNLAYLSGHLPQVSLFLFRYLSNTRNRVNAQLISAR